MKREEYYKHTLYMLTHKTKVTTDLVYNE